MPASVIDLFCGCGGFSLGASQAGFDVSTSIDIDSTLTSSYRSNFPSSNLILADISQLSGEQLIKSNGGVPAGIIGGPPCQGFSVIGKRKKSDPRNELLSHYFRLISEIKPQFFVMENVPGLLAKDTAQYLTRALNLIVGDYDLIDPFVLNAADCGAATNRKRVLVVGYRRAYCDKPQFDFELEPVSVRDAISDLPTERMRSVLRENHTFGRYRENPSEYALSMRQAPPNGFGSRLSRNMRGRKLVSGCSFTKHTDEVVERYKTLKQGEMDPISRYTKLRWSEPSNTLRAGTGKEGGSFQAARPIHPFQNRVITVREAARLQGFPDWFMFHPTIWHSFRMIGNSVAPMMAKAVLSELSRCTGAAKIAA